MRDSSAVDGLLVGSSRLKRADAVRRLSGKHTLSSTDYWTKRRVRWSWGWTKVEKLGLASPSYPNMRLLPVGLS